MITRYTAYSNSLQEGSFIMLLTLATVFGLMTLVSTVIVIASCWVAASASETLQIEPFPLRTDMQPQDGLFTMAEAAA